MPRIARNLLFAIVAIAMLYGLDYLLANGVAGMAISPFHSRILMLSGIAITLAVSLNLIIGFTGQFSLGHAGFMAVGAYSGAYFTVN
jgi:branched-chain amino acid transport system permease protein